MQRVTHYKAEQAGVAEVCVLAGPGPEQREERLVRWAHQGTLSREDAVCRGTGMIRDILELFKKGISGIGGGLGCGWGAKGTHSRITE